VDNDTHPAVDSRAGPRSWLGVAALALPTLLLSVDMTVLILALPELSADLNTTSEEQLWIVDIYGFMLAGTLVTMGGLGDRIGRRKLLLVGCGAFGATSVLAAYSVSPEMLILARALLGMAGATIMPSALALIRTLFPDPKQRKTAVAVFMSCFMAGASLGPVVGGAILTSFWWGAVFLLNVPIMLAVLVVGPMVLPEFRGPGGRIDLVNAILPLATLLPIIYGLKQLAHDGWRLPPIGVLLIGVAMGVVFVRRQRSQRYPLLDLRLFRVPAFSGAVGILLFGSIMMSGTSLFVTLFLQSVKGYTAFHTGLWLALSAVSMVIGTMIGPTLARRVRPSMVIAAGLAACALGFALLATVGIQTGMAVLISGIIIASAGGGAFGALATDLVLGAAPHERAGVATAVSETGSELGVALGIALLGSVGTAVYHAALVLPDGVTAEVAGAARENIAGAVAAAGRLPTEVGASLLHNAQSAFTTALNAVTGASAIIALLLSLLALIVLRTER
jgi:MFS transporter, DHA2 family, multidrug resistance protein